MAGQRILKVSEDFRELDEYLHGNGISSLLLVCGRSFRYLRIAEHFDRLENKLGVKIVKFSDFQPNPRYETVVKGVEIFRKNNCDCIIAVGGGSAIDVAKCIKLYSSMTGNGERGEFLCQESKENKIKFLAMPTTAGTGSEITRYAVIYYKGEKQSVMHESIIPDTVLFDTSVLATLPVYQKKSTMLDALCHAIESFWSVNSTKESKRYSSHAIRLIMANMDGYLNNEEISNANMFEAAYIAGKAINITQTTAGHAMCYKLTSLYGVAHGNAAALCVRRLWPWMLSHMEKCIDPRGRDYVENTFLELGNIIGYEDVVQGAWWFSRLVDELGVSIPWIKTVQDYEKLSRTVNPDRLRNNPIALDTKAVDELYHEILKDKNK